MKFDFKKAFSPLLAIFGGVASLLLMIVSYAKVTFSNFPPEAFCGYELIKLGDTSIKSTTEVVLRSIGKELGGSFFFVLVSVLQIIAIAASALLIVAGVAGLLKRLGAVDIFAKIRLSERSAYRALFASLFITFMLSAIFTIVLVFVNLYKLEGFVSATYFGIEPAAGFYILTVFSALVFGAYALYADKTADGE